MKSWQTLIFLSVLTASIHAQEAHNVTQDPLSTLKNYTVLSNTSMSAGLPERVHFELLKASGLTHVIDLIPDDRTEERMLLEELNLNYLNIPVDWETPTIENFQSYVAQMQMNTQEGGVTLTHCRLNWRGAVFSYLYQVTQLGIPEPEAKQTMLNIWQPNEVWQNYIEDVLAHYEFK